MANIHIDATRILSTRCIVYSAWERTGSLLDAGHSTITTFDDIEGWYGRIGTDTLPPEIDALGAYTLARSEAVKKFYQDRYNAAYAAILSEYPAVAGGRFDMGEIEITESAQ